MLIDVANESLIALVSQSREVIGHVPSQQHITFVPAHQETRVTRRMPWRRQSQNRATQCHRPGPGKSVYRGRVELESSGREAAIHRSGHEAKQTAWEAGHRRPLSLRYPHAPWVKSNQRSDMISVEVGQHHAIEVVRLEPEPSELRNQRFCWRDVKSGSCHA